MVVGWQVIQAIKLVIRHEIGLADYGRKTGSYLPLGFERLLDGISRVCERARTVKIKHRETKYTM